MNFFRSTEWYSNLLYNTYDTRDSAIFFQKRVKIKMKESDQVGVRIKMLLKYQYARNLNITVPVQLRT